MIFKFIICCILRHKWRKILWKIEPANYFGSSIKLIAWYVDVEKTVGTSKTHMFTGLNQPWSRRCILLSQRDLLLKLLMLCCTSLDWFIGRFAVEVVDLIGPAKLLLRSIYRLFNFGVLIDSSAIVVLGGVSVYQSVTSAIWDWPWYFLSLILPIMASWRPLRLTMQCARTTLRPRTPPALHTDISRRRRFRSLAHGMK